MSLDDKLSESLFNKSDDEYNFDANADFQSVIGGGRTVYSPSEGTYFNFRDDTMQSRMGRTTAGGESVRPMTAIGGAGFQSQSQSHSQHGLLNAGSNKLESEKRETQKTPQEIIRQLEKDVHKLIEESSTVLHKGEAFHALQLAEKAVNKDKILTKRRKSFSLSSQLGQRLTFAACFHLAKVYESNKLYDRAIETYEKLIKQRRFKDFVVQIRINIGNLFCMEGQFPQAIRMYRMALDQTTHEDTHVKSKILRNIGNTFIKFGKLRDAIVSYDNAVGTSFDIKSCFNLLSCYVESNDHEKSKQTLFRMINGALKILDSSEEADDLEPSESEKRDELNKNQKNADNMLHTAARLVANMMEGENWTDSFLWVHEQLDRKFPQVAFQIEIERAVEHLQQGEYAAAVKIFKSYENKDIKFKTMVAVNLSFFFFLEGNYSSANEYADIAISSNKYNPCALVNKGNCLFIQEDYENARECYLEAIAIQSTCFEAIYNLSLTNIRLDHTSEAMQSLAKLHTVSSNDPRVLYQVANLYEEMNEESSATKWFNVLSATVPTDPGILSRLGQLFLRTNNESQSFHYHLESFRCYPSDIDVIGWLAVWFVKHEMIEKSIYFFSRASQIQRSEIKWKIMIATCYRKMGKNSKALSLFKNTLKDFPHSEECLEHLISICQDMGISCEKYKIELESITSETQKKTEFSPHHITISNQSKRVNDSSTDIAMEDVSDKDMNLLLA